MRDYRPRVLDDVLARRLRSSGAVLLEGPKACGKTFAAEQITNSAVYLDRDDNALAALQVDPSLVLNGATPQLIDEWQLEDTRVWNYVRSEVGRRGEPGQFVLTGSSVPADDARRHTGAGRFARLHMRPMSLFESGESTGTVSLAALMAGERPTAGPSALTVTDIARVLVRGGWPLNLGLDPRDASQANVDYLRNIAEVDISRVEQTRRDPQTAQRVLLALARNTAMEHKIARIAREVESNEEPALARSTLYDYLPALQRLMVLELQPAWNTHMRSKSRLVEAERTHFVDPSLAAAALDAGPERLLSDLNTFGLLFESLAVRDFRIYSDLLDATVHHYRDRDQLEVDIVVQRRTGEWGAFEVKLGNSDDIVNGAATNLAALAQKVETQKAGKPAVLGVITGTGYAYVRQDGVAVIPIGHLGP